MIMNRLDVYEWFYTLSVTLQLSGAVLLLIRYCFVSIEKELQEIEKRKTHVENELIVFGRTQPTPYEYKESVWLNRIAFTYISVGYLLNVLGMIECRNKIMAFFLIVVLSSILTFSSVQIAKKLSKDKETN